MKITRILDGNSYLYRMALLDEHTIALVANEDISGKIAVMFRPDEYITFKVEGIPYQVEKDVVFCIVVFAAVKKDHVFRYMNVDQKIEKIINSGD